MKSIILILLATSSFASHAECLKDYDRELFPHWLDIDNDGLDARKQAIKLQMVNESLYYDPYTGTNYDPKANVPDVDHLVPLKLAWQRGANCWTTEKRQAFANDPLNLVAVHLSANRQKSAKSIYDWMPSNLSYCSDYLERLKLIVEKYELKPTGGHLKAHKIMARECKRLEKGIKVDYYRTWLEKLGVTF